MNHSKQRYIIINFSLEFIDTKKTVMLPHIPNMRYRAFLSWGLEFRCMKNTNTL